MGRLKAYGVGEVRLASNRTYFFDMQYTVGESLYLTITESERVGTNSFDRNHIMVFEEYFQPFSHTLNKIQDF